MPSRPSLKFYAIDCKHEVSETKPSMYSCLREREVRGECCMIYFEPVLVISRYNTVGGWWSALTECEIMMPLV